MATKSKTDARLKRKSRIKKRIRGTTERPRLSIFRSAGHMYAQVIDDRSGKTLVDASSLSKEIRSRLPAGGGNSAGAGIVGEFIAKRALEKGIKKVVFDRNGFLYHGRVKALAESARQHGLEF
jgi:large subunit ribosomal protein L18